MFPPCIDIYVLSKSRDKNTIEKFLAGFTDRESIENREDEELMILGDATFVDEKYYWIKAETLTNTINVGLSSSNVCFTIYFKTNHPKVTSASITFTVDGKIVWGLSLFEYDDVGQTVNNYYIATGLKDEALTQYEGQLWVISTETKPPISEQEFYELIKIWTNK